MEIFVSLIIIVFGILQIILFFKIWGMTDDIREIKKKYMQSQSTVKEVYISNAPAPAPEGSNAPVAAAKKTNKFKIDDLVVHIATDKQMRVKAITEEGRYSCYTNAGMKHEGDFLETEIRLF